MEKTKDPENSEQYLFNKQVNDIKRCVLKDEVKVENKHCYNSLSHHISINQSYIYMQSPGSKVMILKTNNAGEDAGKYNIYVFVLLM